MPAAPAATRKSLSLLNVFIICLPFLSLLVETESVSAQQAEADVLVAQAVLAYDEKRYDEALRLLERALELDPRDPRGLYYLGLVYLALEQPSRAIPPLKTLRTLRPTDIQAQYQLGVAYFTVGDYERAGPLLEEVFRQKPDLENLGYYVGIVRHQRKDYSEALKAFDAVKTSDPDIRQLSLFYKGLSLGVLGLPKQALAELESAQRVQAVSPVTGTAVRIQEALAAGARPGEAKRLRAQVSVGGFYDDNVPVNPNPSNDPVAQNFRRRQATSPGMLGSLLLDYSFYREGAFEATATYSLFQTVNFKSGPENTGPNKFNMQNHLGGLSGFYRGTLGSLAYQLAGQYTFDYLFLDEAGFLSRHTPTFSATVVEPNVVLPFLGAVGNLTNVQYRYQVKEFFREPVANDIRFSSEQRDGLNNMFGLLHLFRFSQDQVLLRLGYQYDREVTKGTSFSYLGHRIQTGGQVTLPWGDVTLRYDYDIHFRNYSNPQTLFVNDAGGLSNRDDIEQMHLLQISKPLTPNLTLTAQGQRLRNDSNIPVYDYTKNVYTLLMTWTY